MTKTIYTRIINSFRPLSGSYISQSLMGLSGISSNRARFRPLSGSYISQLELKSVLGRELYIVSVPYRGATFLNDTSPFSRAFVLEFPSPIGELHFSIKKALALTRAEITVSVPYRGATFLNRWVHGMGGLYPVSVPYRGATFLNRLSGYLQ